MVVMMKLALGSKWVLRYMHIAYQGQALESLKLSKDGLNHFLLGVMSRISP